MAASTSDPGSRDERRVRVFRAPTHDVALPETYPSWQSDLQYVDEALQTQSGPEAERYVQLAERRLARRRARHRSDHADEGDAVSRSGSGTAQR